VTQRQVILATRERGVIVGDIDDMRPDLSSFGIRGPVLMRPLPMVNDRELAEGTDYTHLPHVGKEFLEERREFVAEIVKTIRMGATIEKVMEKYGKSERQCFRYFKMAGLPIKHRRAK
jgi:hypothetical protein